jgi:hypothetical protein
VDVSLLWWNVKVRATLQPAVNQSWCRASLGDQDPIFLSLKVPRLCLCGAPSLSRGHSQLYMSTTIYNFTRIYYGAGMDDRWVGVQFPVPGLHFSVLHTFRPPLGPTQPPLQYAPAAVFPGVKRQGRVADYSPSSSVEVKNSGLIPPFPHMSSWRGAWLSMPRPLTLLLLTYLRSWILIEKTANCATTQELPSILWKPKVHYRVHKIPSPRLLMNLRNKLIFFKVRSC